MTYPTYVRANKPKTGEKFYFEGQLFEARESANCKGCHFLTNGKCLSAPHCDEHVYVRLDDVAANDLATAVAQAAEQIRRCDYTPARSTLLVALAKFKEATK